LNPAGIRKYFLFVMSRVALGPSQPRIQRVPELFPEHDVDHSPPSNAKLKNEWRCTPTAIIQHNVVDRDGVAIFTFTVCKYTLTAEE